MSEANHPTLCQTIPIYNYLLDIIEDFIDQKKPSEDVVIAANNAKEKLLRYYPTSDGLVYIISTTQITINPPNTSNVLVNHIYKKRKFVQSDELDNYLNSPPANIETNTLLYWKLHEKESLNLAKMARDYLAVPGILIFWVIGLN
ncbi:unnamed protein product [Rhizophagus irregularis]|uniref:HAT C-terminal dimerisation domain-containing protein n=1 Tax=Rhizophagus irregularis TaxID=588596 RepID=A0A916EHZ0_9GLOM|nr:unnamed protein product [Rhizophagus irregularis]